MRYEAEIWDSGYPRQAGICFPAKRIGKLDTWAAARRWANETRRELEQANSKLEYVTVIYRDGYCLEMF